MAVAGVYLAAAAFLTTPNDWDGLTYHETRALLWDAQGRVGYVPSGNDPRLDGNPPVSEIGLYAALVLPHSERFAALPQFVALWASLLAVVLIARRLGLPRAASAFGGLVFATLPVVLLHGAAVLNDLVVASFLLVAAGFLAGRSRAELIVGSVALGLALSTKFSAALSLPVLVAAVLALAPARRRAASLVACGGGVLLGAPWYVINLAETGSLDGGLGDTTGQAADHSVRGVLGTLRALVFDVVDTTGLWRSELYLAVVVGAGMVALGLLLMRRAAISGRALACGGLVVVSVPLVLRAVERPTSYAWRHFWFKIGQKGISLDHGDAWKVLGLPDTSLSWYGAPGAMVILGGVVAAVVGIRRGALRRGALLLALAPLTLVATFALTIVYDPWRGRLVMFAVGLACAAWGWTIRIRWLSVGLAALCVTTAALSLVHSYTKPSGLGLLESSISRSVWHRDRIDTLTVIRNYDGTPAAPARGGGRRAGGRRARSRNADRHVPRPTGRTAALADAASRRRRREGSARRDVAREQRPGRCVGLPCRLVDGLRGRRERLAPVPPHGAGRMWSGRNAALTARRRQVAAAAGTGRDDVVRNVADAVGANRLVLRERPDQ